MTLPTPDPHSKQVAFNFLVSLDKKSKRQEKSDSKKRVLPTEGGHPAVIQVTIQP